MWRGIFINWIRLKERSSYWGIRKDCWRNRSIDWFRRLGRKRLRLRLSIGKNKIIWLSLPPLRFNTKLSFRNYKTHWSSTNKRIGTWSKKTKICMDNSPPSTNYSTNSKPWITYKCIDLNIAEWQKCRS